MNSNNQNEEKNLDTILLRERLSHISNSETFSEDIKKVALLENNSAISLMIHEEHENALRKKQTSLSSQKNILLFVCIVIFSLSSIACIYFFWYTPKKESLSEDAYSQKNREIPDQFFIAEDTEILTKDISSEIELELKQIKLKKINSQTTKKILFSHNTRCSLEKIEEISKTIIPLGIKSSFYTNCLLGLYSYGEKPSFFFITQLRDLSELPTLDQWDQDLSKTFTPLFGIDRFTADKTDVYTKKFTPLVYKNKDLRVLHTNSGTPILYYGFILNKFLVISENKQTISYLEGRLRK